MSNNQTRRTGGFLNPRTTLCLWFALLAVLPLPLLGQGKSESVVKVSGYLSTSAVRPGDKFKIAVVLDIAKGYHINAHVPSMDSLIATQADFTTPPGITIGEVKYPAADEKTFSFAPDTRLAVYEGTVVITAEAEAASTMPENPVAIAMRVTIQACTDQICLPPGKVQTQITADVVAPGTPVQSVNAELFSELKQFQGKGPKKDDLSELIASSGFPLALLTVFLAGLALNLTPCVYPIIPITIGFFVNQATSESKSKLSRTLPMAIMYVFGMAITYSLLGVMASLTGGLFGGALQSPIVLVGLASVMVVLALSMFGVYEFRMPQFMNRFASKSTESASGAVGALLMGLTTGIIAAPCIGPFVLGLLVHVSAKGEPLYGFLIFFVLALGLGLPYMLLGTFSGAIKALPRSGEWMVAVRKVFGLVLIGMALYFLIPLMGAYSSDVFITFFASAALYLIFWESGRARPVKFAWILRAIGVGSAAVAVIIAMPRKIEAEIPWQPYSEESLASAQKEGRPVVIDVFADWCIPCKELDQVTFTDAAVKQEAARFVTLKLNLTTNDPATEAGQAKDRFDVIGVPTVIFLDVQGREDESLRLTGFEKPGQFLARLKRVPSLSSATPPETIPGSAGTP